MKTRVYLDTSVLSLYFDARSPERRDETIKFWSRLERYDVSTSTEAEREIMRTPDPELRSRLLGLLQSVSVIAVTAEMNEVADRYVSEGIFTVGMRPDAIHVAVASVARQDVLLSWNYSHLVNRQRRLWIATINVSLGLPTPDIIAPPEL